MLGMFLEKTSRFQKDTGKPQTSRSSQWNIPVILAESEAIPYLSCSGA
jgi:hypothetical protein